MDAPATATAYCFRPCQFDAPFQCLVTNKPRGSSVKFSGQLAHRRPRVMGFRELASHRFPPPARRGQRGQSLSNAMMRPMGELSRIQVTSAWVRDRMSRNTFHTAAGRQVGLLPEVFPSLQKLLLCHSVKNTFDQLTNPPYPLDYDHGRITR